MPKQKSNPWQKLFVLVLCLASLILLERITLVRQETAYPDLPLSTDVVVIGSGLTGACAALAAADFGAHVVYLDLAEPEGRFLPYFSPYFWAAGTPVQQELEMSYLPEDMAAGVLATEEGEDFSGPLFAVCQASAQALSWFEVQVDASFSRPARDNPGLHGAENYPGPQAALALKNRLSREVAAVFTGWQPERILVEKNRVVGLVASDDRGQNKEIRAQAVIIADGGFAANPSLVKGYTGRQEHYLRPEGGHRGTGLLLARAAGALAEGLSRVIPVPVKLPEGGRVHPGEFARAVFLSKDGEFLPPEDLTLALRQAGDSILAVKSAAGTDTEFVFSGAGELAQALGLEEELLGVALAGHNAPYVVLELGLAAIMPGGLVTDESFAVRGLEGLFAAGEVVAGLPGEKEFLDLYLSAEVTSAYLAGRYAAELARR